MKTRNELSPMDLQTILNALVLARGVYEGLKGPGGMEFTFPEELQHERVEELITRIRDF